MRSAAADVHCWCIESSTLINGCIAVYYVAAAHIGWRDSAMAIHTLGRKIHGELCMRFDMFDINVKAHTCIDVDKRFCHTSY